MSIIKNPLFLLGFTLGAILIFSSVSTIILFLAPSSIFLFLFTIMLTIISVWLFLWAFLWMFLFELFTTKSKFLFGLSIMIVTILSWSSIYDFSYSFVRDRFTFGSKNSFGGFAFLDNTPLRIPENKKNKWEAYCGQFKKSNGQSIKEITIRDSGMYCGRFPIKMGEKTRYTVPFKILPNNKALYWLSPFLQIEAPKPKKN